MALTFIKSGAVTRKRVMEISETYDDNHYIKVTDRWLDKKTGRIERSEFVHSRREKTENINFYINHCRHKYEVPEENIIYITRGEKMSKPRDRRIELVIIQSTRRPDELSLRLDADDATATPLIKELTAKFQAGDEAILVLRRDFIEMLDVFRDYKSKEKGNDNH